MENENCLFCRIAAQKIPAHVIYEDKHAIAFLDITPRSAGHTMVIPKRHAANLIELPVVEVGPLFEAVQKVDGMIVKSLEPDGMTIGMNQGAASGQEIPHLHVHLIPRHKGDGGTSVQGVVHRPSRESVEEIAKKLRGA